EVRSHHDVLDEILSLSEEKSVEDGREDRNEQEYQRSRQNARPLVVFCLERLVADFLLIHLLVDLCLRVHRVVIVHRKLKVERRSKRADVEKRGGKEIDDVERHEQWKRLQVPH